MTGKDEKSGVDGRLIRRIVRQLLPYRFWVLVAFVTVMSAAFLGPLRPKLVQIAIDNHIVIADMEGLRTMIIYLIIVLMAEGLLSFFNSYLTQWIGQQAIFDLRTRLYRHIQSQPLGFFDRTPVGRLITRVTSDVESLNQVLSAGVVTILGDMFKLLFIGYFMFTLNWRLALVTLAVLPILLFATFWFKRKVRDQYRETRKQVARLNSFLEEHVTGMKIVQTFNREREELRRFRSINDDHRQAHIKTIFYFALFWPVIDIISSSALGLVLWVGGMSAMSSTLTLGVLIAFVQYVRQFFEPIRNLSDQFNTLQSAMAGAERIYGLLDTDRALPVPKKAAAPAKLSGRIEFRDVWFSYDPKADRVPTGKRDSDASVEYLVEATGSTDPGMHTEWILKGVSFIAEPGSSVAIVGATGAGKTTIINLLLRFYDIQGGQILLDGVDIREFDLRNLREHVGLVLQDVFLFSGSVERNITLDNDEIDSGSVREAASLIGAEGFIDRLPGGFAHEVRERGMSLSHGQRQLVSFIRALVYDPEILVLDEATSSVDTETEAVIQDALETLMQGRTCIAIAHRLSTIQHADQILVMHHGEIRERGSHIELIRADGIYRRLYELQYRDQEVAGAA